MGRNAFPQEFEGKENKLYRISSSIFSIDFSKPSAVYIRFKYGEKNIDFIDLRYDYGEQIEDTKTIEEESYSKIQIENKIGYSEIFRQKNKTNALKKVYNINSSEIQKLFLKNIITSFPAYRYEEPGYLNDIYKITLEFSKHNVFSGYLKNPIEVTKGLEDIANWLMDIVLDFHNSQQISPHINDLVNSLFGEQDSIKINKQIFSSFIFGIASLSSYSKPNEINLLNNINKLFTYILASKHSKKVH